MKFALPMTLLALLTAGAAVTWFGYTEHGVVPPANAQTAEAPEAPAAKAERKILYYRNPMGLPDTSPEPKKDSMGMDYIPVYEDDAPDGSGAVAVSPARLQTLGVKTARAQMQTLEAPVRAVGRIEIDERSIHDVAPRFEGWIEKLHVSATGDPVKRGQALFSVYSPELVSARKEVSIAQRLVDSAPGGAAAESAKRLLAAARERLRYWQVGSGGASDAVTFVSPVKGIVLEKQAVEGMRFMAGTPVFRIADLDRVWVIADIYEQDLAQIHLGQHARISVDAFPGRDFDAQVTYLYPTLNTGTRTTPVRLELDNASGLLRPGMFAHVDLAAGRSEARLVVPKSALVENGERQVVFVVQGEGRFKPQPVEVGLRGRDQVEITRGLSTGDEVVVAANFLIDSESNLKAALSAFDEPGSTAPSYQGVGAIDSIDASDNTVSMNHEPIPALQWPAMTMDFGLDSPELVKGIMPGEPVRFDFEDRGDGEFVITHIEKTGQAGHAGH